MNFEKMSLILLGSMVSVTMSVSSSQAAEKTGSVEAIWSSLESTKKQAASMDKPLSTDQLVKAVKQKLAKQGVNKKAARLNLQLPPKKQKMSKLDRQRAAWKAKWLAEQDAKKKQASADLVITTTQKKATQKQVQVKDSKTAVSKKTPKLIAKQPQKLLTRAQYQWRWKQQQLKKQQQLAQLKQPVKPTVNTKLMHKAFRSNRVAAKYNSLPFNVTHKLRSARLNERAMSVYVQDANSVKPLLAHQDKVSRVPASVMKLITSYAALGTLGTNYRWPLDVYTTGKVSNGTLQGDLIIKGYGSPEFNTAELRKVLQGIRQKGIRNVSGRIVFDDSYFNVISQRAGDFDGKAHASYNAKPDALLFNERINSFQVRTSGNRVHVNSTTPTHNLKIVNRMKKYKRSCRPRIGVSHRGEQTIVTFTGGFARRCGTRTYSRVISRPANMIYGAMQAMWKRDVGGTLNTRFAMGRVPAKARPLLRTYSRTLAEILPTIDKDSNNVMARQLLLTIGAKKFGVGTERNSANAVGAWLKTRGLNFPELRIENGSGLSRTARISARHVGDLLVDAYRSPYRNVLMQSLAVAGVDGTMKRRLRGTNVRGRGFFKTGTLRDVRSIAGYVKAADGKTYVMAILHNDPRAKGRALAAHNQLIQWVFSGGRKQQLALR